MKIPLFALLTASAGLAAEADSGQAASDSASAPASDTSYTSYDYDYRLDYGYRPGSESGSESYSAAAGSPASLLLSEARIAMALVDFQMGGRLGVASSWGGIPVDFFLDAEGRPYRRAVRVRESETLEYQFREHRFTFGPGVSAGLPLGNDSILLMAGAGAGISFGVYRGTAREAPVSFPLWLEGGLRFLLPKGWHMGIMYQYFPLPSAPSHRINLVFGGRKRAGETD